MCDMCYSSAAVTFRMKVEVKPNKMRMIILQFAKHFDINP